MKKIYTLFILIVSVVILAACTKKPDLIVYMPGAYIGEDVISDFREKTGKRVSIVTFDDNETALMQATDTSNRYDIIVPSDYAIEELVKLDLIEKIDWTKVTGFNKETGLVGELSDSLQALKTEGFDFLEYAIPYFWGSVGFLYNKEKFTLAQVTDNEWNLFYDQGNSAVVYDSSRDAFLMAFHATTEGAFNTATQAQINDAEAWLRTVTGRNNVVILGDQILDAPGNLTQDLIQVYSGDAIYIMQENNRYAYYKPTHTNVWADGFVIPKNARNKELAYEFISFMLSYEIAYTNSTEIGYTTPVLAVFDDIVEAEFSDYTSTYVVEFDETSDEFFRYNQNLKTMLDTAWRRVRTN